MKGLCQGAAFGLLMVSLVAPIFVDELRGIYSASLTAIGFAILANSYKGD